MATLLWIGGATFLEWVAAGVWKGGKVSAEYACAYSK